jgi:hypothetical protein
MAAEAQSRSETQRTQNMKSRKMTASYAVLSLDEIRQIFLFAERSAIASYGHAEGAACVILRGESVRMKGKVQANFSTLCANGEEVRLKY